MSRAAPMLRRDLGWTLAALLLILLWEWSGLDLAAVRLWGDASGFAWREAWLTSKLLHEGGRMLAWVILVLMVLDAWRLWLDGPSRRERVQAIAASLLAVLLVPAIKRVSSTSCPWDLAEFGGAARYVSHWQFGVLDGGAGHCFPSGHAAAGFAFFSLYLLWRGHRPRLARWMLLAVLGLGAIFGMAQMARGAHYPSHSMWSAWLCWVLVWLVQSAPGWRFNPARARPRPEAT
jgi:membrane-associated PAP2 superfamily phosphatase